MLTSRTAQLADTANWVHGCFMVRVGSDFNTYREIMTYAMQDELYGSLGSPGLEPNVKQILSSGGDDGPLPVYFTKRKCRDTSLGGNDAINPLPQFAEDDDIGHPHLRTNFGDTHGMGQVYSENYDDLQQILYLGFGILVFNNVGAFWKNATDDDLGKYMNHGTGITAEKIGELIGRTPIMLIRLATVPLKFIKAMVSRIEEVKISKYCSFSSQMPMYFRFVNTILVQLAVNMSIMGSDDDNNTTGSTVSGTTAIGLLNEGTTQSQDLAGVSNTFREFGLDMARIMTKRYVYENGRDSLQNRYTDQALIEASNLNTTEAEVYEPPADQPSTSEPAEPNPDGSIPEGSAAARQDVSVDDTKKWTMSWFDGFKAAYGDAIYDGHLFIGFRVEKGPGTTESFSNSTGESQLAATANEKFQQGREARYATMNGKFGTGAFGSVMDQVLGAANGVLKGLTSSFSMDAAAAVVTGSSKISVPDVWSGSTWSRSASFTLNCLSPYGDPQSIYQSLYVPFACLLAGTLPRATGQSSHSSPFVCQAYCRGVFSSPLCIIENLDVTRGADQFGFAMSRLPTELTINVTLKDLSPTMYMNMGGNGSILKDIMGSDDVFGEYMMTMSGMGLRERLSPFRSMRRKARILLATAYKNKLSPYMLGMEGGSRFLISRTISAVVSGGRGLPDR